MVTNTPNTELLETPPTEAGGILKFNGVALAKILADQPDAVSGPVRWFANYCASHRLSKADAGRLLKKPNGDYYSYDSITQLLGGGRIRRGENIDPILDAIRAFQKIEQAREEQTNSGFIETRLFREIERRFQRALLRQRILWIIGDSQIGKSTCLQEVQRRHHHSHTIYIEVPTGGSLSRFLRDLAGQLNIPISSNVGHLAREIIRSFDSRMALIVDEAHRALIRSRASGPSPIFDFLRELYNKVRCGIVIAMTNEGRNELLNGAHSKSYEQIWRRRITPLQLPSVTPQDDLDLFAAAFGLPPAPDKAVTIRVSYIDGEGVSKTKSHTDSPLRLQTAINKTDSLGVWISILQDAADMAAEQNKAITWGAVIKAAAQAQAEAEIYQ